MKRRNISRCPKGYTMVNGVCQQTISNQLTPGDTSIIPGGDERADCHSACEDMYPYQYCNSSSCNCSCCHTYTWQTLVGQVVNYSTNPPTYEDQYETHSQCNCSPCWSNYTQCVGNCLSSGVGGTSHGRGIGTGRF